MNIESIELITPHGHAFFMIPIERNYAYIDIKLSDGSKIKHIIDIEGITKEKETVEK